MEQHPLVQPSIQQKLQQQYQTQIPHPSRQSDTSLKAASLEKSSIEIPSRSATVA